MSRYSACTPRTVTKLCVSGITRHCLPLQAAGLPRTTPRKDWPLPLLKQILTESVQETPGHLLASELWCGCGSASEWRAYQAGYTSSTAAMSMVRHTEKHT